MAGSFRSRILLAAAVAAFAVASTVASTYERGRDVVIEAWRWVTRRVDLGVRWLVSRMPRTQADWLRRDLAVRVHLDGTINMRAVPKRRPMVSPRWRMVPSI